MAGTFRIFSETENSSFNKEKSNKIIPLKSKSIGNTGLISSKGFSQSLKSKGLSIRSESELNVFIPNKSKSSSAKEVKLPEKKTASADQKLVPSMELSKDKLAEINDKKLLPLKQNEDDFVFAKPEPPVDSKKTKKYPEPEKLCYYFDQTEYMVEEMKMIFNEDLQVVKSARLLEEATLKETEVCEDEGFISGGEIDSFEVNSDFAELSLSDVELPEISDLDDSIM